MLESQYNHRNFPFVAPARETDPAEMAPEARWTETEHRDHLVQFYESEDFLASTVAEYARLGLEAGETFIVAATEQHIKQFERAIEASGVNVVSARSSVISLSSKRERCFQDHGRRHAGPGAI